MYGPLCRVVAERGRPEFLYEEDPLLLLAIPLADATESVRVAVGAFLTRPIAPAEDLARVARILGTGTASARAWAARQTPWSPHGLRQMSELLLERLADKRRIAEAQRETAGLAQHLSEVYEEISLLHRLMENLKLSKSVEGLGQLALEWVEGLFPAQALALQLTSGRPAGPEPAPDSILIVRGQCPVDDRQFAELVRHVSRGAAGQPVVINRGFQSQDGWPCPQVREMILVPLPEGKNLFGWLAAFNHADGGEFGTREAYLLNSVAAVLGTHCGNTALYRHQAELMAGIIRALTATIDAKDQYTCGHSDRVARIAVRLAQELHCDPATVEMVNLAGQLHDIGKIGVNDSVLRKPGKLTDEEYRHIQRHPEIGHRILRDMKGLDAILPAILHHHEAWDGTGYPGKLHQDEIPLIARIVAVADAFDAMASNRPYRKGMSDERIDQIFHSGADAQWDPQVVAALFAARDDVRRIIAGAADEGVL